MMKRVLALIALAALLTMSAASALAYDVLFEAGGSFAYVRNEQGEMYVWGDNQFGQLGKGGKTQNKNPAMFKTKNAEIDPKEVRQIYAGSDYSYLLMNDGAIYGVGNNVHGELTVKNGYCTTHVRVNLDDLTIQKMAAGFGHTLALNEQGEVYAWGRNNAGQVGNGKSANVYTPYKLPLSNIVDIAAGGKFSLALDADGVLWGWGDNANHELADTKEKTIKTPVKLNIGGLKIKLLDAGGSFISIVDDAGKLYMWGVNDVFQLGFDSKGKDVPSPRLVEELPLPVVYLASYSSQTYVILSDGSLWGWGNNTYGQLGLGFRTASGKGVTVSKIYDSDCERVIGGSLFMNVLLKDGTVLAAGINKFGQLGLATREYEISKIFANGFHLKTAAE